MHAPPSSAPPNRRSFPVSALARASASLAALATVLAGIPYTLWRLGELPEEVPTWDRARDVLTSPDDGSVLVGGLTAAGWVLWALLVYALLLEGAAVLRRRAARRRRGLAGMQQLATWILGGLVTLSTPAIASAAGAPPAVAATVTADETGEAVEASEGGEFPGNGGAVTGHEQDPGPEPRFTVTAGDMTLWDIAERELGDGTRWVHLQALNPGLEADTDATGVLRVGTELAMPSDYVASERLAAPEMREAVASGQQTEKPGDDARGTVVVTVAPNDTLWELSGEHLGAPGRYTEIYQDNRQVIGDDPDLVRPGQELVIHDSQLAASPLEPAERAPDQPEENRAPAEEAPPAPEPSAEAPPQAGDRPEPGGSGTPVPDQPATEGEEAAARESEEGLAEDPGHAATAGDDGASVPASVLALSAAGVMAAGVLGLVAHRRRLQQRRRRPGHRIPKPAASAATTEQALRYVEIGDQVAHLRRALQTAAAHLAAAGRELPAVAAVTLTPRGATLHLASPAEPIAPFSADEDESGVAARRWRVPAGSKQVLSAEDLRNVEAPYPTLAAIGHDADGALVLVDLEQAGAVHLTGDRRHQMLRTLAAELAVSELADTLELVLVGALVAPGLEQLGITERVTRYDSVEKAAPVLHTQHRDQQAAMTAIGADHLRQARLSDDLDGAWEPLIILADGAFATDAAADEALRGLLEMVSLGPRAAAAVVTSGVPLDEDGPQPEGAWVLNTDRGAAVVVPGTDLRVVLEPLTDEDYADLVEIAATALSEQDVPTPEVPTPVVPKLTAAGIAEAPAEDDGGTPASAPSPDVTGSALMGGLAMYEDPVAEPNGAPHEDYIGPHSSAPLAPVGFGKAAEHLVGADGRPAGPAAPLPTGQADGPMVRLLGPVDITGARGKVESARRRVLLETAAWIALHPDAPRRAMDQALWPGDREVDRKVRNPRISKLRAWLGRDAAGELYMPRGLYAFSDGVRCDWHVFQELVAASRRASGPDAEGLLHEALTLVRGRPFSGIDPRRYTWAEHDAQDMISAIDDAATELAEYHLESRAPRAALWAATKGLEAVEESERLHRIAFRAHHALGDREGLERAATRLETLLTAWQIDMEDSTSLLLGKLLDRRPAGSRLARSADS